MRENRLRTLWQQNRHAVNGWLAIPNSFRAEVMAHQGWDTLTVDMQHGVIDYAQMVPMLQAISTTPTVPIVRVPWLEPGIVMKSLDAGAYGIICPMVNTREDAQRLVAYTHYAPKGSRSFGPVRANLYGGADYAQKANDTIVAFAMIETKQALDNLDDILSVEGLDAVYIGPSDLSLALGCRPVFDDVDPPVAQAIEHILERAKAHGVRAGVHNGVPEVAKRARGDGLRLRDAELRCAHPHARVAAAARGDEVGHPRRRSRRVRARPEAASAPVAAVSSPCMSFRSLLRRSRTAGKAKLSSSRRCRSWIAMNCPVCGMQCVERARRQRRHAFVHLAQQRAELLPHLVQRVVVGLQPARDVGQPQVAGGAAGAAPRAALRRHGAPARRSRNSARRRARRCARRHRGPRSAGARRAGAAGRASCAGARGRRRASRTAARSPTSGARTCGSDTTTPSGMQPLWAPGTPPRADRFDPAQGSVRASGLPPPRRAARHRWLRRLREQLRHHRHRDHLGLLAGDARHADRAGEARSTSGAMPRASKRCTKRARLVFEPIRPR